MGQERTYPEANNPINGALEITRIVAEQQVPIPPLAGRQILSTT